MLVPADIINRPSIILALPPIVFDSAGDGIKLIVSQDRHVVIAVRRSVLSGDFVLSGSLLRHSLGGGGAQRTGGQGAPFGCYQSRPANPMSGMRIATC
jgi:hypothetical protein